MIINHKNKEYRLNYRFPWEFIFCHWKLRSAIRIWALHHWTDRMKDLWFDRGFRFLGIEFMKRVYGAGPKKHLFSRQIMRAKSFRTILWRFRRIFFRQDIKLCDCGAEITSEQDKHNEEIAAISNTKKLDMCPNCWEDYCNHAITGD